MADFLDTTLTTIQELRHAETPGAFLKQRMATSADSLSNAAKIQSSVEVANEALFKLTSILFETVDRIPVNVDAKTYRLLIPAPWGDSGYSKWGMRSTEARILRSVLMWRAHNDPKSALFDYGDRRWFLNVATYKSAAAALAHLKEKPITSREWMRHTNAWHERERQRSNKQVTSK